MKLFKMFGATTLATLIATAGIFAFAPFGATTNTATANTQINSLGGTNSNNSTNGATTESTGLITPRADDPVIFTTESGLDIKTSLELTGSLAGFPYFITNDGTTDYYWVIIGIANNLTSIFSTSQTGCNIGMWQEKNTTSSNYYYNNIRDDTEAGSKVHGANIVGGIVQDDSISTSCSILPNSTSEIPHNCVLVLSSIPLANDIYGSSNYFASSKIKSTMNNWLDDGSYGLNWIRKSVVELSVKTVDSILGTETTQSYLFTLAATEGSSFNYTSYCTYAQLKTGNSGTFWFRGMMSGGIISYRHNGAGLVGYGAGLSAEYRPAFVMSL